MPVKAILLSKRIQFSHSFGLTGPWQAPSCGGFKVCSKAPQQCSENVLSPLALPAHFPMFNLQLGLEPWPVQPDWAAVAPESCVSFRVYKSKPMMYFFFFLSAVITYSVFFYMLHLKSKFKGLFKSWDFLGSRFCFCWKRIQLWVASCVGVTAQRDLLPAAGGKWLRSLSVIHESSERRQFMCRRSKNSADVISSMWESNYAGWH